MKSEREKREKGRYERDTEKERERGKQEREVVKQERKRET